MKRILLSLLLFSLSGCRVTLLEKHEHYHYPVPATQPAASESR